jgi:hypothetical protein
MTHAEIARQLGIGIRNVCHAEAMGAFRYLVMLAEAFGEPLPPIGHEGCHRASGWHRKAD